jgi:hypothetical protein
MCAESICPSLCKEHCTAVVNLGVHLQNKHATPAAVRKQIIQQLSHFPTTASGAVELPEQPAWPIEELGTLRDSSKCQTCEFITVSTDAIRQHCKKDTSKRGRMRKASCFTLSKYRRFSVAEGAEILHCSLRCS